MAAIIGALRAVLSASIAQFEKDMGNAANGVKKFAKSFDDAAANLTRAGAIMSAAITAPVVLLAKSSAEAAIEAEELHGKFQGVFRSLADEVGAWAEQTGDALGRSTTQMENTAATFGNLFNKAAPTRKEAAALSQQFAQLSLDLAAFQEISEEDALDKLRGGLQGATKGLKEFGVLFTDADVKARAYKLGLAEVGQELSANVQVMARASIISEQLAYVNGELANSQGSLEEQQKRLNAEWEELQIQIGQLVLPLMQQLVGVLTEVVTWFKELDPGMQQAIAAVAGFAAVIGPLLIVLGGIAGAIASITKLLPAMAGGLGALNAVLMKAGISARTLLGALSAIALAPMAFDFGKDIGKDLGHQAGILQAMATYGISYDEAVAKYEEGERKKLIAMRDAQAAQQKAIDDNNAMVLAKQDALNAKQLALDDALHQAQIKAEQDAQAKIAAAAASDAAQKAAEAELQRQIAEAEDNAQQVAQAWLDSYDRFWSQGDYAPDPYKDFGDDAPASDIEPMVDLPEFDIATDMTMINDGIDHAVDAFADLAFYGGDAEDVVKRLLQQLVDMVLLQPALEAMANGLKGFASGLFGGGGGGGGGFGDLLSQGIGSAFGGIGDFFGGFFAKGGTLKRGEWGIAGENGPEPIFAGDGDLEIMPNSMMGGGGGVRDVNIYTPDANSFHRSSRQVARDVNRMTARTE